MAYISQLKYEDASGETKKVIDEWVNEHGPLTNMKETLIHSIPAFHALMEWFPLEAEIESFLGERAVNFSVMQSQRQMIVCCAACSLRRSWMMQELTSNTLRLPKRRRYLSNMAGRS